MPPVITGVIASLLLTLNILFWCILLFAFTLLKIILPIRPVRKLLTAILTLIANAWVSCNSGWMWLTQKMDWTIQRPATLDKKRLVFCHQ